MAPNKKSLTDAKRAQPRKSAPEIPQKGIDGPGHHLRAASDADFDDAERDSCTVAHHRDDEISDS